MSWRAVIATVSAWVSLAGTASAQENTVCAERKPPSQAERSERRVRTGQEFRRDYGMPASRRHVARVIRSREETPDFGIALSPREVRYLRALEETTQTAGWRRIERYVARRPSVSGGLSVGNDYPRGGAAIVRWTRDADRHGAALRRLARLPVRVRRVDHSERELNRAQDRIDFDALESEGISIRGASVDVDRSRVVLDVISARPDAVQRVEERFGPLVTADVIATEPSSPVCVPVGRVTVSDDGLRLKLRYTTNSAFSFERVFVAEEDQRVRVAIVERAPNGPVTLKAESRQAQVTLSAPLGDRKLVHARNGRPVSRAEGN